MRINVLDPSLPIFYGNIYIVWWILEGSGGSHRNLRKMLFNVVLDCDRLLSTPPRCTRPTTSWQTSCYEPQSEKDWELDQLGGLGVGPTSAFC